LSFTSQTIEREGSSGKIGLGGLAACILPSRRIECKLGQGAFSNERVANRGLLLIEFVRNDA